MFPEYLVFLISDDIKEDHIRRFLKPETEKQNPLGSELVVKVKYKGSIIWENYAQPNGLSSINLLENKATTNLSVADTYRFTQKYPFT